MFKNKVLNSPDLQGKEFTDLKFFHCQFRGTHRFASFTRCLFDTCDFTGADLEDATFDHCRFPESRLSQLDFSRTFFHACDYSSGIFIGAHFVQRDGNHRQVRFNLSNTKFLHSDLTQAVFDHVNLTWAEFTGSNLKLAIFDHSLLDHTDFTACDLEGTAFVDCAIKQAKLDFGGFVSYGRSKGFTTG